MNRIKWRIRREILTALNFNPASIIEMELSGIVTKILVTDEDLSDILSSALYGGISYWCKCVYPKDGHWKGRYAEDHIVKGGSLILEDSYLEDHELNKFKMLRGIACLIESDGLDCCGFENEDAYYVNAENTAFTLKASHCLDTGDIDANIADSIVQYGIFGEQVFV